MTYSISHQAILIVTATSLISISLSLFSSLHRHKNSPVMERWHTPSSPTAIPLSPDSPSLISLMVSVDVKHHVYLLSLFSSLSLFQSHPYLPLSFPIYIDIKTHLSWNDDTLDFTPDNLYNYSRKPHLCLSVCLSLLSSLHSHKNSRSMKRWHTRLHTRQPWQLGCKPHPHLSLSLFSSLLRHKNSPVMERWHTGLHTRRPL